MDVIRILIVDKDDKVRQTVRRHAEAEGFFVDEAQDGISALKLCRRINYHIVVLDRDLPELAPWHVCRQIRKYADTPIVMLSSSATEEEKLMLFGEGIDDFLPKPFSCRELIARIRVILRHMAMTPGAAYRLVFGGIALDTAARAVSIDDVPISLSPKEYALLEFFAKHPGQAMTRETLLTEVWGADFFGTDRTIDTHVKTLRLALAPYGDLIATVWGYGYSFAGQETPNQ